MAKVAVLSCVAVLIVFGGLWLQMSRGADPALGSKSVAGADKQVRRYYDDEESSSALAFTPAPAPAPAPVVTSTS